MSDDRKYCKKHNLPYRKECSECFVDRKLAERAAKKDKIEHHCDGCIWAHRDSGKVLCPFPRCVERGGWIVVEK